jgi:phytoene synthase
MNRDKGGLSYCARAVREHDHDRYLTALFVPADRREAVFAL